MGPPCAASLLENPEHTVIFADENLKNAIKEALGHLSNDMDVPMLMRLRSLQAGHRGIQSLNGIEVCKCLVDLDLSYNDIEDIEPISGLRDLKNLNLSGNEISSLEALSGLTSIQRLWVRENRIRDLSPLVNLQDIEYLNLSYNGIESLGPLLENPGLDSGDTLVLYGNPITTGTLGKTLEDLAWHRVKTHYLGR